MNYLGMALTPEEIEVRRIKVSHVEFCDQGILDEADVDGDGQINYTEFYDLMTNNN